MKKREENTAERICGGSLSFIRETLVKREKSQPTVILGHQKSDSRQKEQILPLILWKHRTHFNTTELMLHTVSSLF